ncbi:endoplasmic reticulum resident 44 isoform X2 [Brachionus plicatilis]|uniref:Endoplasmic reticulum resident 44 isoform X2 n=1 Tax=Brachionus plicatilis TaxID=10195 RepID=A0A3M7RVB6_BRAPC|nr:endoplasmic reticulum resident 44 isoform X2 [Brachionus plicatilis]
MNLGKKLSIILCLCFIHQAHSGALKLTSQNYDAVLSSNEVVFVNFYASWCRFSQMLEPIFDDFAEKAMNEFPMGKLSIAKVDCEAEGQIASKNQVNKYPTLKMFRNGLAVKKEYRGARSADAFISYVRDQLQNPIKTAKTYPEFTIALNEKKKRILIGYFLNDQVESFKVFTKLTSFLRDSCSFIAVLADQNIVQRDNLEQISFKQDLEHNEIIYNGELSNYEALYAWANEKCTPLVREITFENAEELTEEGLPFLILFHKPEDTESIKLFEGEVARQLGHFKNTITCVHADGNKFSHPLHHLGKTAADLPVLAIDSFRHMYLFPDYKKMTSEGNNLAKFVEDLHSGKLHREFHNGPDQTPELSKVEPSNGNHLPNVKDDNKPKAPGGTTPPESVFIKLAPSKDRYSIKFDGEL